MEAFLNWAKDRICIVWNDNYVDREDPILDFIELHHLEMSSSIPFDPYYLLVKITNRVNEIYNSESYGPDDPIIEETSVFLYYDENLNDSFYYTADEILDEYTSKLIYTGFI